MPDLATIDGIWRPDQLSNGKWILIRWFRKAGEVRQELFKESGATILFNTEAMANLMAGKMSR